MADPCPLVLLYGFPMDGRIWADLGDLPVRPTVPDLSDFTHPYGRPAITGFTIDDLADAVHKVIRRLGCRCVVGGLSMGGYVALSLADRHPTDLAGLVLFDTKATADDAAGRAARDEMIAGLQNGSLDLAGTMERRLLSPAASLRVRDRFRQMAYSVPRDTLVSALAAMRDRPDRSGVLGRIDVPTLCVVGADDAVTPPAVVDAMRRQIKGAELAVIPDAGHITPLENPAAVTEVLRAFLGRV